MKVNTVSLTVSDIDDNNNKTGLENGFDILNINDKFKHNINQFCNIPKKLQNSNLCNNDFMSELADYIISIQNCNKDNKQNVNILFVNSGNSKKVNDIIKILNLDVSCSIYHLVVQTKIDTDETQDCNIGGIIINKTKQAHNIIVEQMGYFKKHLVTYSSKWNEILTFNIQVLVDDSSFAFGKDYKFGGTVIKYYCHSVFNHDNDSHDISNSNKYKFGSNELDNYVNTIEYMRQISHMTENEKCRGLGFTQTAIGLSNQTISLIYDDVFDIYLINDRSQNNIISKIGNEYFKISIRKFTIDLAHRYINNLFDYDLITLIDINNLPLCMDKIKTESELFTNGELNNSSFSYHTEMSDIDEHYYITMSELDKFYDEFISNDCTLTQDEKMRYQSVYYKPRRYALKSIAAECMQYNNNMITTAKKAKTI